MNPNELTPRYLQALAQIVQTRQGLICFYLTCTYSAIGGALLAVRGSYTWLQTLLVVAMVIVCLTFAGVVAYLVTKDPTRPSSPTKR
jgi:hypothetical protein